MAIIYVNPQGTLTHICCCLVDLCGAGILLELNLLSPWYYPAVNIIVSIVREDSVAMAAVVHVFYTAMATYTVLKLTF